ncbi:MAG: SHOCT domain-containing protein [Ruminococcaceae bacterium]|nr:SHOCT domain-containing protein [Oscillospiraceae bacterium]
MDFWIWIIFGVIFMAAVIVAIYASQAKNVKNHDSKLSQNGFKTTRRAGVLRVDDNNKKWCINDGIRAIQIYNFSDVVDCKIDENSVLNKVNKLGVYIYTLNGGAIYIPIYNGELKRDSFLYKSSIDLAQQICSLLESIKVLKNTESLDIVQTPTNSSAPVDDIEEQLKKFKGMVDSGLITQEDYEAKKKQLLGI